jgi:enamine deaminase RidA (YjgF/YER057c/UK114 family)
VVAIKKIQPEGLVDHGQLYSHVVVGGGKDIVFVAGQVALDETGSLIGQGDLGSQARKAFENVRTALASVGAKPADIAKLTMYVVDHRPEDLPAIFGAREEVLGEPTAASLIGVPRLARPGYLIEVEAIAVLG